jgi:hypothetical protein
MMIDKDASAWRWWRPGNQAAGISFQSFFLFSGFDLPTLWDAA